MTTTLREFILNQSTLPTGNLVRDHLNNPKTGTSGSLVLSDGLEVEMSDDCFDIGIDLSELTIEVGEDLVVEIETDEFDVGIC